MRIGILGHDFISGGGGMDFLRPIFDSWLAAKRARKTRFQLLIPDSGPRRAIRHQTELIPCSIMTKAVGVFASALTHRCHANI